VADTFVRHRQPWTSEEVAKLRLLAGKGMAMRAIAKALTRSEESVKARAKIDGLKIRKLH
jgi:DNA-binding NarL/FixJ family response regulator